MNRNKKWDWLLKDKFMPSYLAANLSFDVLKQKMILSPDIPHACTLEDDEIKIKS